MNSITPAIGCWVIALLLWYMMAGCAHQPFPEGDRVNPPFGYIIYCIENPGSPFCEDK